MRSNLNIGVNAVAIIGLHHFNIRVAANELAALRTFYTDVVGLTVGPRPPFQSVGTWLYAGSIPILHLTQMNTGETVAPGSPEALPESLEKRCSAFDHIALACTDLDDTLRRLNSHGVQYMGPRYLPSGKFSCSSGTRVASPSSLSSRHRIGQRQFGNRQGGHQFGHLGTFSQGGYHLPQQTFFPRVIQPLPDPITSSQPRGETYGTSRLAFAFSLPANARRRHIGRSCRGNEKNAQDNVQERVGL
jgi:catechol 2,3-dioxygenase-like lactoylglutathione lyase family enzyme